MHGILRNMSFVRQGPSFWGPEDHVNMRILDNMAWHDVVHSDMVYVLALRPKARGIPKAMLCRILALFLAAVIWVPLWNDKVYTKPPRVLNLPLFGSYSGIIRSNGPSWGEFCGPSLCLAFLTLSSAVCIPYRLQVDRWAFKELLHPNFGL